MLTTAPDSSAQRKRKATKITSKAPVVTTKPELKPESVVMLPAGARPQVDTALFNPKPSARVRSRRRFDVKVVPAAPPGRSRQEILYTDSLIHRTRR
jgi:hypothetical protein